MNKHQHVPGEPLMPVEGRLAEALGIDPSTFEQGTLRYSLEGGHIGLVRYTGVLQVDAKTFTTALRQAQIEYDTDRALVAQHQQDPQ